MDLIEVANAEERRLALVVREFAAEATPVRRGGDQGPGGSVEGWEGGVAGRGAPGVWVNMAVGVGMNGPVEREELARIAAWYEEAGIEPRFEVCPYANESLVHGLASLGFVVRGFESVLFRDLAGEIPSPRGPIPGVEVRVLDPRDGAAVRAFAEVVQRQFTPPGEEVAEGAVDVMMRCVRHPRVVTLAAWAGDRIVGGGALEVWEDVATLFGLAVAPEFRRRGIQTAIMAERLRIARDRGVRAATIGARPGAVPSPTERNARRAGFQVAYTKACLVRPGPGLRAVTG